MEFKLEAKAKRWWRDSTNCWVVETEVQLGDDFGYYNCRTPWPVGERPEKEQILGLLKVAIDNALGEL